MGINMKILMVCEFFDDKLDYQENMLARAFGKADHEVLIIASTITSLQDYVADKDKGKGAPSEIDCDWGRLVRLPFRINLLHRIKQFTSIRPTLEAFKPDLLFFHDIIPNLTEGVRYVREHPRCAMIMDYHADASNSGANWLSRKLLHGVFRKKILDHARPYLRKILPVTPGGTEFLSEHYGVPVSEMELLPLGTDQQYAAQISDSDVRHRIRAELGIGADDLVVFTGGKFAPYKRTEDVLAAVSRLNGSAAHAIVVGSADAAHLGYAQHIENLAAENPRLHMVGWQDREGVYAHMAACDIAVFPASQSVLWQQSLGMGLPLILSERSEALRGVQSVGYLNRHDNLIVLDLEQPLTDQIASHLQRLSLDRPRLAAMSRGARQTAAEILDYDTIAARILSFADVQQ
jgi:1,2-diacylglycerol 3-alpha-glucosyltransferase